MDRDGIDAEPAFPSMGLVNYLIESAEAKPDSAQACDHWLIKRCKGRLDRFVPVAIIPTRKLNVRSAPTDQKSCRTPVLS